MRSEHRLRVAVAAVATVMWVAWTADGPCAVGNSAVAADEAVGASDEGHAAGAGGDAAHPDAASHEEGDAHPAGEDAHHPDTSLPPIMPKAAMGELFVFSLLFFWLFHGPWLKMKRAVDARDFPAAGAQLNRIRQIIMVNLPLGLIVVIVGASGRYWG